MSLLVEHLLLVATVLPMLGAAVAALVPRPAVRWVGLGFSGAGVLAALLVAVLPRLGLALGSPVLSLNVGKVDLSLRLSGGVVGVGLCIVPAVAALSAMFLDWQHGPARRREVTLPLLLNSAAMLVVLGASPVTVLAGLVLSSAGCVLVMKGSRDDPAATVLSATHGVSSALLLVVVASMLGDSEGLSARTTTLLVVLATLLRLGFPPFHGAVSACAGASSAAVRLLLGMVGGTTSGAVLLRLMPEGVVLPIGWALVGASGMVFGAFVAMGAHSLRHVAVGLHVALASLVLCGATLHDATPNDAGATVAAVLALSVAPTAILLLGRAIERRLGSDAFVSLGGLSQSMPSALMLMIGSAGVAALLPGTSGFVSLLLVLVRASGLGGVSGWTIVVLLAVAFVLLTAASTRLVRRTFFGPLDAGSVAPSELRWWESVAVVPVLLLALLGGVAPMMFF